MLEIKMTDKLNYIGRTGENERATAVFDLTRWMMEYPEGEYTLINKRKGDTTAYPVLNAEIRGSSLRWLLSGADLARSGTGQCELIIRKDGVIAKDIIYKYYVEPSLDGSGEPPEEPWDIWQAEFTQIHREALESAEAAERDAQAAEEAKEAAEEAAEAAEAAEVHQPIVRDGNWWVWDGVSGDYADTGYAAQGEPGEPGKPGQPGQDGVSPTVTITSITGGHRITITDADGEHTADVMDGGKGDPGAPGDDGYSPTVSITTITGGHRITITDKTGSHAADVMDGEDGDPTTLIDDTAGAGDTGKTFSADKLSGELGSLMSALNQSTAATNSDIGKAHSPKTVVDGKVTEWQYVPVGGGVGSVEPQDTTFFDAIVGKNKYNPEECAPQNNAWYNGSGAVVSNVSTSAVSGKIPIVPGLTYTFSAGGCQIRDYVLFNGDAFISKTDKFGAISATFTAPNNATHVGFNLFYSQNTHTDADYTAAISSSMLELGASATEYEPYTLSYVMPTSYLLDADAVNAAKATLEKRPGINLYDKVLAVDGQYYDSNNGGQVAAAKFAISGKIPVLPNTQYCFSCDPSLQITKYVGEYAQNGTYIGKKECSNNRSLVFFTGPTTYYIGINIMASREHTSADFTALVNTLMLTYGACRPTAYTAYEENYHSTPLDFKYTGVKWISCGTSITWYNSQLYQSGLHTGEFCRGYNGLIAEETGILLTNDGINGATLANINSSSFINRYNSIDWTAYDIATIEFAVNDNGNNVDLGSTSAAANTTDFCGCLKTVIEYILAQNPTIILILCTDPDVRTLSPNTAGYTLKDYCDAIKTIADLYRLPVCDWYYRSGINPTTKGSTSLDYLTADGTHPNDKGHARMAKLLLQTMEGVM